MAIGNMILMHECFPKQFHMGTSIIKYNIETAKKCKKKRANSERRTASREIGFKTAYRPPGIATPGSSG